MGTALSFAKQKVVWNVQWGGVVKKKKRVQLLKQQPAKYHRHIWIDGSGLVIHLQGILPFPCLPFKKKTIWAMIWIGSWALMIGEKYLYEGVLLFIMKIYFIFAKQNYRKQTFHLLLQCFLHFTEQVICAASGMPRWNMTEGWSIYLNVPFKVWGHIKDSWHQQCWIFPCCLQPEL